MIELAYNTPKMGGVDNLNQLTLIFREGIVGTIKNYSGD